MKQFILLLLVALALGGSAYATTRNVTCSGDITSAFQAAVNASVNGDTVAISAGSCSSGLVSWTDKNITVSGAGKGATNITTTNVNFLEIFTSGSNVPTWHLTGMSLSSTASGTAFVIRAWAAHSNTFRGPFHIDHVSFNYPNQSPDGLVALFGPMYGVFDHDDFVMIIEAAIETSLENDDTETCSFNVGGPCSTLQDMENGALQGNAGLTIPYSVGGAQNIFIEDCTFSVPTPGSDQAYSAIDTAYGGGRMVFRHNTLTNVDLYAHWTNGHSVNTLWWEVYNNTFTWTGSNNGLYPMRMQGGGTGLIHDNTLINWPANVIKLGDGRLPDQGQSSVPENYCDGTQPVDGNAGDSNAHGWPCLAQTGRNVGVTITQIANGMKQGTFPMYIWNNGPQAKCSNPGAAGAACDNSFSFSPDASPSAANYFKTTPHSTSGFGNGDVDLSKTASQPAGAGNHTLTYTPFTYPHPLTGNAMCTPSKVVYTSQPMSALQGASVGTITIAVQDTGGNTCTNDTSTVTLTKHAGTCAGMTLNGTLSGPASSGLFTTTNVNLTGGTGSCSLDAADGALTGATSNAFTISAPAQLTITVVQGANGTIAPGTTSVTQGNNQTFTISPNANYTIQNVVVDGTNHSPVSSPWTDLGTQGANGFIRSIAYVGAGIVVGGGDTIIRSTNYGVSWTNLGAQAAGTILRLEYAGNNVVLAGVSDGSSGHILRSANSGSTWADLGQQFGQSHVYGLTSLGNGIVLAGTKPGGLILRSTDYGATWTNLGQQGSETNIQTFASLGNGVVVAGTAGTGDIWRSTDNGLTWTNLGTQAGEVDIDFVVALGNAVCIASTFPNGKLLRSANNGLTWTDLGKFDTGTFMSNAASVGNGLAIAGAGTSGHVWTSTDYGATWTDIGQQGSTETNIRATYLENGIFVAGTSPDGKIIRSTAFGFGPTTSYTFNNVQVTHTITANFVSIPVVTPVPLVGAGRFIIRRH